MRVAGKGLIDRSKPLRFTFDGKTYRGFAGDTVASALLANGVTLMGRSFKYHRPRGVLTAGSEEPNALITTGRGARAEPNVRATVQEVYDGLVTRSQNAWPSLDFDVMAVNDLAAPFLGAGFYYKTFMWPRRFWEAIYEPVIRKAAGLGALSGASNPDTYERAYAFCDLLVIGAGPTGLMAALTAARAGADVILADEDSLMGGRLNAETGAVGHTSGAVWAKGIVAELAGMDNVRLMPRTTVTGAYDGGMYGALERVNQHTSRRGGGAPLEAFWRISARQSILAAGALERPVAFQNNDRPGIMTAGAVRAYLNRWGVSPGKRVAVFGNNDDAHRTARDLVAAGVHVVALIDSRHDATVKGFDGQVFKGAQVCNSGGRKELESITVRTATGEEALQVDCLAMSGGWNPTVHLTCHMNGRPTWREDIQSFVPTPGRDSAHDGGRGVQRGVFDPWLSERRGRGGQGGAEGAGQEGGRGRGAGGGRCALCAGTALGGGRQGARLARFPERCVGQGCQTGGGGELSLGRAYETLYHAGHGDGSGEEFQRGGAGHSGRCDGARDTRDGDDDLPATL